MDGVFLRKKFDIGLFILFLFGLFFIGLYVFCYIVASPKNGQSLSFLIMGMFMWLIVIPSWLLNFGAFIRVDDNSVKGKYHWFGKIDCDMNDIEFASAKINTLIIQLKDGKRHIIMGLENNWELCSEILRNIQFEATEPPKKLIAKLNDWKNEKRKNWHLLFCGLVLMFINIFIAVFLTGERELYEFSKIDWIIFSIMGVIEIATVIATFYFAQKAGKNDISIEKLNYTIKRTIVETNPLLPGKVIKVYTDAYCTGRITVFGYPNDKSVYFVTQIFDSDFNLIKSYESEIFENIEDLDESVKVLIDITERVFA